MVIHSLEFYSCCCNFVEFSNWIASARLLLYLHPCLFGSDVIFKEWMCFAYDSSSTTHGEAFSGHQRELITSSDKILFLKFIIRKKRASERQKSLSLCYSSNFHLSCLASLLEQNETLLKKGKLRLTLNFNHLHYKSHTHPRNTKNWWLCAAASPIYTSSPIFSWGLLLPNERWQIWNGPSLSPIRILEVPQMLLLIILQVSWPPKFSSGK